MDTIIEAKKSIKHHIKFLESLKQHIQKGEEPMLSRAMFATYCLHRYINDKLMDDVIDTMNAEGADINV